MLMNGFMPRLTNRSARRSWRNGGARVKMIEQGTRQAPKARATAVAVTIPGKVVRAAIAIVVPVGVIAGDGIGMNAGGWL
jgi:hypothetical protein